MKTIAIIVLKLMVSIGLLAFLYRNIPVNDIWSVLGRINTFYLPGICLLLFLNTILSAWKWQLFLKTDGITIALKDLIVSYMSGTFCNLFLPSNIGGDSYRIYDIAQQSKETTRSAASVFADRFSGFVALVTLSLLSSTYIALQGGGVQLLVLPGLLSILFTVVLFLLLTPGVFTSVLAITRLNRIGWIVRVTEKLLISFSRYGSDGKLIARVMLLSFVFQFSVITVVYFLSRSIGAETGFFYFVAFVPLITLMEALPISIYGIGVRDYGYVFFFSQAGMGDLETRTLALLFMAVAVCYSLVGGLFFGYKLWSRPRE